MSKNVRNSSAMSVINFNSEAGATGATGATGAQGSPGSMVYATQNSISMNYDPASLLFTNPIASVIGCEKIGNMIFIKIMGFVESPVGQSTLTSTVGCVPVAFRPASNQITTAIVVNGFEEIFGSGYFDRDAPYNTFFGTCELSTAGTLTFGPERGPSFGPISVDGSILTPFQGPKPCGLISQTLMFRADNII